MENEEIVKEGEKERERETFKGVNRVNVLLFSDQ